MLVAQSASDIHLASAWHQFQDGFQNRLSCWRRFDQSNTPPRFLELMQVLNCDLFHATSLVPDEREPVFCKALNGAMFAFMKETSEEATMEFHHTCQM